MSSGRYLRDRRLLGDAEVIRLYLELRDSVRVGILAGIDPTRVLDICRAAGVAIQKRGGQPSRHKLQISEEEIVRRYREGESGIQLAGEAGCSAYTIYRVLDDAGVPRRPGSIGLKRGRRRGVTPGGGAHG